MGMAELMKPENLAHGGQAKGLALFNPGDDTGSVTSTIACAGIDPLGVEKAGLFFGDRLRVPGHDGLILSVEEVAQNDGEFDRIEEAAFAMPISLEASCQLVVLEDLALE